MDLLDAIKPRFTDPVRKRGDDYFYAGVVSVLSRDTDWALFEVEGSYEDYEVVVQHIRGNDYSLQCTCPHFDEGNHCKHLWAAARVAQARGFFKTSQGAMARQPQTAGWLQQLQTATPRQPQNDDFGKPLRLHYLVEVIDERPTPVVSLYQQKLRKNGEWGSIRPLEGAFDKLSPPDPVDRHAVACLRGNQLPEVSPVFDNYYYARYRQAADPEVELSSELLGTVLPALAATGRLVWTLSGDLEWDDATPLGWDDGPAWGFRLRVRRARDGKPIRLAGELVRGEEVRPLSDAVRVYRGGAVLLDNQLARFDTPEDYRWVETLVANEQLEVPAGERETLLEELWRHGAPPEIAGDASLAKAGRLGEPTGELKVHPTDNRSRNLYASIAYRYDGHTASPGSQAAAWRATKGRGIITRNPAAEAMLRDRLLELGAQPKQDNQYGSTPPGHMQLVARDLPRIVSALVEEGWRVEAEGALIRRSGSLSVSVSSGVDWFDLEGGFDFDGVEAPLPEVLAALERGEQYVLLGDGSKGLLPEEWLKRYAPLKGLAAGQEGESLRFHSGQALLLDAMLSAQQAEVSVDQQFAKQRKQLRSFTGVKPAAAPKAFRGELRDYQREGLGWLRFLEKFGFGGCLADDMGLGKTIQVLALLADRRRRQPKDEAPRPSLVVAPKSLVHNWRLEAERFTPGLRVVDYTGLDRKRRVTDFAEYDLVLTTYGTLRKDIERLAEAEWDYAVLDEAQAIKNATSQAAKAARVLRARRRLALSGTPVENHLGELWSLIDFLNPGLLGSNTTFKRLAKETTDGDKERLETLQRGLAPFMLRRTKEQVLPQLPAKTEQPLYCDLSKTERTTYNELRDHYRLSLTQRIEDEGLAKSKVHVLEALLRLRQAACHPGLIDAKRRDKPSAKLALLQEQLDEAVTEGHKALVFSQFTTLLGMVRERLDKAGVCYEYLDGKTRNRQERVERFQSDPDCRVFLVSLKAGGVGLNLTAADYVFLLDPWWNPAVEAQAIDRVHRLGQDRPVFAYRLIARDTVEEKILELQARKSELADAIVSENASLLRSLSAEDLQALLA